MEGYVLLFSYGEKHLLTWNSDMVATEERKIAARNSAVKKQEPSEKKTPAPAEK